MSTDRSAASNDGAAELQRAADDATCVGSSAASVRLWLLDKLVGLWVWMKFR